MSYDLYSPSIFVIGDNLVLHEIVTRPTDCAVRRLSVGYSEASNGVAPFPTGSVEFIEILERPRSL